MKPVCLSAVALFLLVGSAARGMAQLPDYLQTAGIGRPRAGGHAALQEFMTLMGVWFAQKGRFQVCSRGVRTGVAAGAALGGGAFRSWAGPATSGADRRRDQGVPAGPAV